MKVLIIEDEGLAAERLVGLVRKYDAGIEIVGELDTVRGAVAWFQTNAAPDLVFMDIQLADGLSFEIFDLVSISCPIVFTTAYNEYALRAFKVVSIDYLLKPIDFEELLRAFAKLRLLQQGAIQSVPVDLEGIRKAMQGMMKPAYKTRFMVKVGERIAAIQVEEVFYFYSENKTVWLKRRDGKKYMIDFTLDELVEVLDPVRFFRLNRQYLSSIEAIRDVSVYSNSRLKVHLLEPVDKEDILISREKVMEFKGWMEGE